jgi:hypothetical protein
MSTDITTSPSATAQSIAGTRRAVTVAGLVGAVASAGFIAGLIVLHDRSLAELARTPVTVAECLVAGLAFIVLAISLSGLAGATELPSWVRSTVAVGCAFVAIQAWASGSVIANVANRVSDAEFDRLGEPTFLLQLITNPMIAACLVGFVALGIIGWRRRSLPRGACVPFILAGVASVTGSFPPIGLFAGLALAWTARTTPVGSDAGMARP